MNLENADNERWAVAIDGEPIDLDIWADQLPRFSEFSIERVSKGSGQVHAFTGPPFSALTTAEDVRAKAETAISQLNGLMWLVYEAPPISFGGTVYRLKVGGIAETHQFVGVGTLRIRGPRAKGLVIGSDGVVIEQMSDDDVVFRQAVSMAKECDLVSDLLTFVGRADNWFDLYKAIELAERLVKGKHHLSALMGDMASALKNVRETANYYRHARTHQPESLCAIADARNVLAGAVKVALSHVTKTTPNAP